MSEERYEIRGKLGQGGLGAVYRAYDKNLNREVAIKRVLADGEAEGQDEATNNLLKEAKALSAIQHPHIVTVYDCGVDEDGPFVVMEILEGRTIDEMVGEGTLGWEDFREVVMQTQEALIAAQDLDLIHRDLKPGNIMVIWLPSGKFQIKLLDFGLAKFGSTPSLQTMDHGNAVFGSIYFMAPEQFERRPLDQRTDLYAMGAIYYYTLTGRYPCEGDTAAEVMASHLQHRISPLGEARPDIPGWASEWVMWHLEREMENRPTNARESLQHFLALEKQANEATASTGETGPKLIKPRTAAVQTAAQKTGGVQLLTGPVSVSAKTGPQVVASAPSKTSGASADIFATKSVKNKSVAGSGPAQGLSSLPKKKGFFANKALIAGLVVGLITLIIIVASMLSGASEEQQRKDDMMAIINKAKEQNSIDLTPEQIESVLKFYVGDDPNWASAAIPLNLAKGDEADEMIADFIVNGEIPADRRKYLIDIAKVRDSELIAKAFVEAAVKTDDYRLAADLLSAVSKKISTSQTAELVDLFRESDSQRLNSILEPIIQGLIKEGNLGDIYEKEFISQHLALAPVEAGKSEAYLRLASGAGADKALEIVKERLEEGELADKRVALAALGSWPNDEVFSVFVEILENTEMSDRLRRDTFKGALSLLKKNNERSEEDAERMWGELRTLCNSRGEKLAVLNGISRLPGSWVDKILKDYAEDFDEDEKISYRAEILLERREEEGLTGEEKDLTDEAD